MGVALEKGVSPAMEVMGSGRQMEKMRIDEKIPVMVSCSHFSPNNRFLLVSQHLPYSELQSYSRALILQLGSTLISDIRRIFRS